jgi:hypothetical protein
MVALNLKAVKPSYPLFFFLFAMRIEFSLPPLRSFEEVYTGLSGSMEISGVSDRLYIV